jgi:hypothetical protein
METCSDKTKKVEMILETVPAPSAAARMWWMDRLAIRSMDMLAGG